MTKIINNYILMKNNFLNGGFMKKLFLTVAVLILSVAVFAQDVEPVRKVWNNGTTDYIPLGTEFQLKADNWNEKTGKIFYTYNSGESIEYTEPVALTEEGPIVISWITQDLWGTVSNAKTYSAIVDGTAPEVKFLVNGPAFTDADGVFYVTKDTGLQLFGEDKLSGTEHIFVNLGSGEKTDVIGDGFIYLVDRTDGEVLAECVAVDYVGNASEKFSTYLYLDNTAPNVYMDLDISPVEINGVQYISPATKINLSASDELSGVEGIYISMNGADFAKYDASLPLQVTESNDYVLQVYAKDNLGNTSEISEMTFSTKLQLPAAELYLNVGNQVKNVEETVVTEVEVVEKTVSGEK